jgi:hypothetical protein
MEENRGVSRQMQVEIEDKTFLSEVLTSEYAMPKRRLKHE